jgi:hypothetical protein
MRMSETGTAPTGGLSVETGGLGGGLSSLGGGLSGGLGGGLGGLRSRNSMSMSALSTATSFAPCTSSTYEQYVSNIGESENEDDPGGIFF